MCARHSTSLVTSKSRSCSGFLTTCRSSRCPILGSISRHPPCCRKPARSLPTRARSTRWSTSFRRRDARSFSPAAGLCVPAPRGRSKNWPRAPAPCLRRRCSRAACSTTIRSRSASSAGSRATSRTSWGCNAISSSQSAQVSTITRSMAATCFPRPRWCRSIPSPLASTTA